MDVATPGNAHHPSPPSRARFGPGSVQMRQQRGDRKGPPPHGLTWAPTWAHMDSLQRPLQKVSFKFNSVLIQSGAPRSWCKISKHSTTMRLWTYRPFCLSYMQLRNTQDYQDWPGLRTAYRSSPPKRRRRAATSRAVGSGKRWPSQRCFRYPALHRWYDLRRYVRYDLIRRRNQSCAAAHGCARLRIEHHLPQSLH